HSHCSVSCHRDITCINATGCIDIKAKGLLIRNRNGVVSHLRDIARIRPTTRVHVSQKDRHWDMHVSGRCPIAYAEQIDGKSLSVANVVEACDDLVMIRTGRENNRGRSTQAGSDSSVSQRNWYGEGDDHLMITSATTATAFDAGRWLQ